VTMDAIDQLIADRMAGKTATQPSAKRPLEGRNESELRQLWRAGRITEEEWRSELAARGKTPQQVADALAYQKGVGLDTKGNLTSSEARAVEALRNAVLPAPAQPPSMPSLNSNFAPPATGVTSSAQAGGISPASLQANNVDPAQATSTAMGWQNPDVYASSGGAVGPAGRTVDQIRGTEYLSDAERDWYLRQTGGAAGGGGASGGSGGGSTPKPVAPNSRADLLNRGALSGPGGAFVLQGQQYRRLNEVVQGEDGQWYIVDPNGQVVGGPYPNQTQANAANVYTQMGPAILGSSQAANIAGRGGLYDPLQNPVFNTASLDQIISAGAQKGAQPGELLGTTNVFGDPLDLTLGAIPDYGGMQLLPDGTFTGQTGDMSVGWGSYGVSQPNLDTATRAGDSLGFLPMSTLDRLTPADRIAVGQALEQFRALDPSFNPNPQGVKSTYDQQVKALLAAANVDQNEWFPEPFAAGGSIATMPHPMMRMRRLPWSWIPDRMPRMPMQRPLVEDEINPIAEPGTPATYGNIPGREHMSWLAPNATPSSWAWYLAQKDAREREADAFKGSNVTGTGQPWPFNMGGNIMTRPHPMYANGGNMLTGSEPLDVIGQYSGQRVATIGEPNALNGGLPTREVLNITPLEPSVPMVTPNGRGKPLPLEDPVMRLQKMRKVVAK